MNVVLIGAGNLATRLSLALHAAEVRIVQVYSRTIAHAGKLAAQLGCSYTDKLEAINPGADLYIYSLKDEALPQVLRRVAPNGGLWVHTAGSVSMDVFKGYIPRYGVLYPLQTFSKERRVDFSEVPFFIEAATEEDTLLLQKIAGLLSGKVQKLSSEKRKIVHLAAVFACNFTNHMYVLADNILKENGLSFDLMLPLIGETAAKVKDMAPSDAQTGPAIRYDKNVMQRQLDMLGSDEQKEIYKIVSKNIHKEALRHE
ncbi:MAG: DUF2520 domain-containing protein [Parabacteroides sp.]|nr:DUF2520 domain-containing protein [Parabacteroides sp.]